jgi:hypothetical protein
LFEAISNDPLELSSWFEAISNDPLELSSWFEAICNELYQLSSWFEAISNELHEIWHGNRLRTYLQIMQVAVFCKSTITNFARVRHFKLASHKFI